MRPVGAEGPVKIGHSEWPRTRLQTYLPWSPVELELAATLPGDRLLEGRFHAKFLADHLRHEWFAASAELTATIEAIRAGTFDIETLPAFSVIRCGWKPPPESIEAGVNLRRLTKLSAAGVEIPKEVSRATFTYGFPPDEVSRRRKIVRDFLAGHREGAA